MANGGSPSLICILSSVQFQSVVVNDIILLVLVDFFLEISDVEICVIFQHELLETIQLCAYVAMTYNGTL